MRSKAVKSSTVEQHQVLATGNNPIDTGPRQPDTADRRTGL